MLFESKATRENRKRALALHGMTIRYVTARAGRTGFRTVRCCVGPCGRIDCLFISKNDISCIAKGASCQLPDVGGWSHPRRQGYGKR